jgi:glycosidase
MDPGTYSDEEAQGGQDAQDDFAWDVDTATPEGQEFSAGEGGEGSWGEGAEWGEGGEWSGEWGGETADVPGEEAGEEACVPVELTDCDVPFFVPVTQPMMQEYVRVTGSFCGWATGAADGAVELTQDGSQWTGVVHLQDATQVEYKYLIKWPDGQEQWCTVYNGAFECAAGSPNSLLTPECGSTDCGLVVQPTCEDGKQNQGEQGVDCGGPCPACQPTGDYDWRDAVLYFVFVDRFFDADPANNSTVGVEKAADYQGGDLKGVKAKLQYLADLGVNAIWITAPYDNRDVAGKGMGDDFHSYSGYHGYWPSPAEEGLKVESHIGTAQDLTDLVDAAHDQFGMKVLFDYVMNHVDDQSQLHKNHKNDGWFHSFKACASSGWGVDCWFTDYLPDLDFDNADARQWSLDDALDWATTFGVDGFRLDAIKHVEDAWLTGLRSRLNQAFPGKSFYLVGETFEYNNCGYINSFVNPKTKLDGQFDFPLRARLAEKILRREGKLGDLELDLNWLRDCYGGAVMSTFIGNHDLPRSIHVADGRFGSTDSGGWTKGWSPDDYQTVQAEGPYRRVALAYSLLMTIPGVPLIYYGDEMGMPGGADPDNRRMMAFGGWNSHQTWLHDRIAALAHIRAQHPALRKGTRAGVDYGQDTYAFRMSDGDETIYVLLNRADGQSNLNGIPAGTYQELISGQNMLVDGPVTVGGQDAKILLAQ